MTYSVVIEPEAQAQVRELKEWWDENRPDSRVRVESALLACVGSLRKNPKRFPRHYKYDVHYVRLKGTPYLVFYQVRDETGAVHIVSVWSGMRKMGPPI